MPGPFEFRPFLSDAPLSYQRLVKQGYFAEPRAGGAAKDDLELQASHAAVFVRQRCEIGARFYVRTVVLYAAYVEFCKARGIVPEDDRGFGRELKIVAPGLGRQKRVWEGEKKSCYTRIHLKDTP